MKVQGSERASPIRSVLFVCTGNICRSPVAEAVFRAMAAARGLDGLDIDSAGVTDWNVGRAPDPRAVAAAGRRGYRLDGRRARQVVRSDFERFDLMLVMESRHLPALASLRPPVWSGRVGLLGPWAADGQGEEIADPYGGGAADFEIMLDRVEAACRRLLDAIEGESRG